MPPAKQLGAARCITFIHRQVSSALQSKYTLCVSKFWPMISRALHKLLIRATAKIKERFIVDMTQEEA